MIKTTTRARTLRAFTAFAIVVGLGVQAAPTWAQGAAPPAAGAAPKPGAPAPPPPGQIPAWQRNLPKAPPPKTPPAAAPAPTPAEPPAPTGPPPLSESLSGMAKAEYEAGRILYQDGDFASALVKFERANELSKDDRLLWNIAVCEKNLRHYARVLTILDQYLALSSDLLTDKDRSDAAALQEAVKGFVSKITFKVNEPGADVFVDDKRIGTTPLAEGVLVEVGTRTFRVEKPGYVPFTSTQSIASAGDLEITAHLVLEVHEGRLLVEASTNDAIFVDGKRVGARRWEGPLKSGPHTVRVTATDMIAFQSEVVIEDDKTRRIPVSLQPLESGGVSPWVFVVGGGVLLAAGAVVGGILLAQPGDPATTPGTIQPGTIALSFGGGRR